MIDELNLVVRQIVRVAMAMPPGSVRPSDQIAPAGGQIAEYATVKIISCEGVGWADAKIEATGPDAYREALELPERFVASVNFFGSPTKDAAGIARYSNAAFDRAMRLDTRLQLASVVALMAAIGVGFLRASAPRNFSAVEDATWQSRGQVDLTFTVINRETATISTLLSAPFSLTTLGPNGVPQTRSAEVTS